MACFYPDLVSTCVTYTGPRTDPATRGQLRNTQISKLTWVWVFPLKLTDRLSGISNPPHGLLFPLSKTSRTPSSRVNVKPMSLLTMTQDEVGVKTGAKGRKLRPHRVSKHRIGSESQEVWWLVSLECFSRATDTVTLNTVPVPEHTGKVFDRVCGTMQIEGGLPHHHSAILDVHPRSVPGT